MFPSRGESIHKFGKSQTIDRGYGRIQSGVYHKFITITKRKGSQTVFTTRNLFIFMVGQGRIELLTLGFSVIHQWGYGVWCCLVIVVTVHKFHPKAEYLLDLNRDNYHDKKWKDSGIGTSISYENYREKQKKEFDEKFLLVQRPPRSWY